MPKVLRIINRLNLGGPTYNAAYLTKHLSSKYETMLLAGMKDDTEASSEFIVRDMGIEPQYIADMHRSINPMNDVKAFFEIIKIIRQFKPDIVHTHAAKSGALGRMAAFICGVPVIVHTFHGHVFHSYFHPVKTKIFILIERFLAGISTKIVAISNLQKKELTQDFKICKPEKMEVIPLGFDLLRFTENQEEKRKKFREDYNVGKDEIAIGLIGRLVPVKNHRLFLDAINQIKSQTTKKVRFFIVGDGEERGNIERYAKDLEIDFISTNFKNEKVLLTFTSWIKNVDYVNAGLDIITLTSFNEGTPVSVIEAQASNKPVVSTMVGGIQDVVIENETALLSPSGNVKAFANNLLKLVEDDDLRNSFGKKGSQHVLQQYGFMRLAADIEGLYDNLLKQ
jgi:glycosyltransferase involved in cell wall biosynthesis